MALPLRVTSAAPAPRTSPSRTPRAQVVAFAAKQLPRIDDALARAVEPLAAPLPAVREAIAEATGLRGTPGHRWRPLMTLAAGMACGAHPDELADVAAAVELTHTASLMLDDLPCMDDAATRRGVPSTHVRIGSAGAILAAVGLLTRSAELLAQSPRGGAALARAWGDAVGLDGMSGGQMVDLAMPDRAALRGAERRLYRRKTTSLSAFAVVAGGLAASATPAQCKALSGFGEDFGWAYQLADDADDAAEDAARGAQSAPGSTARQRERLLRRATRRLRNVTWRDRASMEMLVLAAHSIVGAATR